MSKTIKNTFSGGELSPDLDGRTDLAKYATGAQLLENFFVTRYGGISNRPGTGYIGESIGSLTKETKMVPFQFSVAQTYVLEFADDKMRVIKDGGIVLTTRRSSTYQWTASAAGTSEYYLELNGGGDPFGSLTGQRAYEVWEDSALMTRGTAGTLSAGEWDVTDNDTLGYNTIYVRLTDSADPDSKAADYIESDYQLYTGLSGDQVKYMTWAQNKDTLFIAMSIDGNAVQPSKIVRSADDSWSYTGLSFSPSNTSPVDVDAVVTGHSTGGRQVIYAVSAINEDLNESLPSTEQIVDLDLNWPTAGRVDIYWNSLRSTVFQWTVSGSGTSEYYCELSGGGDPSIVEPEQLWEDKNEAPTGTVGSLAAGEWAYGDNDALGFSTVYVRLSDSADPDTKAVGYITYKTEADDQWSVYKNYRGDWGWIGAVQTPWFLDDNVEPEVSIAPKVDRDPFNTGDDDDYPGVVAIYQQRLIYARSNNNPQRVWTSVLGDLTNFATSKPLSAEDPITVTLESGGRVDEIKAAVPTLRNLLVLTSGSEWTYGAGENSDQLTPASVAFDNQGYKGVSSFINPIGIENDVLFVQRNNKDVAQLRFRLDSGGFVPAELTLFAPHLFENRTIVDWCYQQHPDNLVWVVMSDGNMLSVTYLPEQEVIAWTQHSTSGRFIACASITTDGDDEVYFTVARDTGNFLEQLSSRDFGGNVRDAKFLDSALTYNPILSISNVVVTATETTVTSTAHGYSNGDFCLVDNVLGIESTGANGDYATFNDRYYKVANVTANTFELNDLDGNALTTTAFSGTYEREGNCWKCTLTVTGLDHLEGETVRVLADGQALEGPFVVSGGSITLGTEDPGYAVVHVGLGYNADLTTLRFDLAAGQSTIQTSKKRMHELWLRFKDSSGGYAAGNSFDNLELIKWRQYEDWQQPNELTTGDKRISLKGGWDREGRIYFRQPDPLPTTILALIMRYSLGDK